MISQGHCQKQCGYLHLSRIHNARTQVETHAIKTGTVFCKEAVTSATVKVIGEVGEPQTTQGALSRKRQTTTGSPDKVRVIDDATLQSKIKKQRQKQQQNDKKEYKQPLEHWQLQIYRSGDGSYKAGSRSTAPSMQLILENNRRSSHIRRLQVLLGVRRLEEESSGGGWAS